MFNDTASVLGSSFYISMLAEKKVQAPDTKMPTTFLG